MPVDQSICQEVSSFFGIQDVHGPEMIVFRADADHLFGYLMVLLYLVYNPVMNASASPVSTIIIPK